MGAKYTDRKRKVTHPSPGPGSRDSPRLSVALPGASTHLGYMTHKNAECWFIRSGKKWTCDHDPARVGYDSVEAALAATVERGRATHRFIHVATLPPSQIGEVPSLALIVERYEPK